MNLLKSIQKVNAHESEYNKYYFEVLVVNLSILLFVFRAANPFFKYPFLLTYFGLIIYSIFNYRYKGLSNAFSFVKNFYIVLASMLILILSYFLSDKLYLIVFKDIINGLVLISIFYFIFVFSEGQYRLEIYYRTFEKLILLFGFFISLGGLLELFDIVAINDTFRNYLYSGVSVKDTIEFDYNFALLPVFFGLLGIMIFQNHHKSRLKNFLVTGFITISSLQILLAGSRRGLIMLVLLFTLFTVIRIIRIWKKTEILAALTTNYNCLLWSFIILAISINIFVFETSSSIKNKIFNTIGVKNSYTVRMKLTSNIYRYASAFDQRLTFKDVFNMIWTPTYDPLDPDSGWATSIHSVEYPLHGKNSNIVPSGAIGYKMNWKSDFKCDEANSYNWTIINSLLKKDSISESSRSYSASVYCYASDDYEGSYVKIYAGTTECLYDLNKKGEWQLLKIDYQSDHELDVSLVWAKIGSLNVKKLKGYVIFAYPQYKKCGMPLSKTINYFKIPYHNTTADFCSFLKIFGLFSQIKADEDPIRKWTSKLFSEDTTYNAYKANIIVDSARNRFIDSRKIHWQFALEIFNKEYSTCKKIFGGGFNFLNWFGYYFGKDKTMSDYPHNPFLYILLYSGILGLSVYLFFLYKVFYYYLKYVKLYPLFFVFFIITFYFSFFSSGSPFDPPIMGFFVILPFFIHSIHKKKEKVSTVSTIMKDGERKI